MKKIFGKKIIKRLICLMLVTGLLLTDMPVKALAAQDEGISGTAGKYEVSSDILTMQNDYTSIHMSGANGGFYISNAEGDKLVKSDNNKDLLYHNDEYDTSFTSFKITKNNVTNTYIFGGDYSFEGIETSPVTVLKDAKGLAARWTLGELEFTQRLEPANSGSNEHGMVCISYDVVNNGTEDVQIEARMLLDTAAGNQDYMYYEIPDSSYQSNIIRKECIIKSDKIPTAFYAYDDMYNPSVVANHVISSKGMLKQVAFAHWNSLAATDFDFAPDESYNFTYEGGGEYRTADSAMAMYYDLGTISAGKQGLVNTYYGVFSNESVNPDVDTVAFNMTAPATLDLSADKKNYISNCNQNEDGSYKEDGIINIQASLKNVSNDIDYKNIAVSVYASEGITPLDKHQKPLDYETSYIRPYSCQFVDFTKGTNINIPFYFKVGVDTSASYRKITFRVYNIPEDSDSNLLFENMLYEGSTYILCPGGQGKLPAITFNSATPQVMYSEFSRHLYITGKNFSMLEDKSRYTLYAQLDENTRYEIPSENITVYPEENKLDVLFNKKMAAGNYKLIFDWIDPPLGVDKKLTGEALNIAMSDDVRYRNDYYGVLAVVQESGTSNSDAKYNIETFANEEAFQKKKDEYEEVLLVFKGDFVKDDTFDAGKNGDNVRYIAKSVQGDSDKIIINGCIDALKGTVTVSKKDGKINTDFDDITLNASVENTRIYKGNAGLTSIEDGKEYSLIPYNTNGEALKGFNDKVITLIYPTALNGLMTIAGMAFSLSFAKLGMMYETKANNVNNLNKDQARGYVMSFSAGLDLGFLIPKSKRNTVKDEPAEDTNGGIFADIGAKADKLRERYDKMIKTNGPISDLFIDNNKNSSEEDDEGKGDIKTKAAVQVDNILYGMNQGFIGVNFKVDVAVPGYTEAMPNIEGTLEVKANSKYIISATPFNTLEDSEGNITNLVYGEEAFSDELILNEPEKATITLTADKKKYQVGRIEHVKDENDNVEEKTVMYDTYDSSTINFTATSDMNVSGTWVFDGEEVKSGEFEDTRSIPINLSGIADGDHTITIQGSNAEGDGFMETFVFNVDTTAPTLLLTSPVNGSGFNEDGQLTISGITEDDAYITVNVDGNPILRSKTLNDINAVMGQEGDFSFDVNIGKGYYRKKIEVIVSDEIGNIQTTQCDVYNNGLGNVKELDLSLSADTTDNTEKEWVSYSGRNLFLNDSGDTSVALQLCAITNDNNTIILNDMENVEWNVGSVIGSAVVDDNKLTIKEDSHGFVEGKLVLADGAALSESFTYGAEVQGEEEESGLKLLYDANGGEGAMTDPNSPYSKNDSVLLAECGFTRTGKKFVEWNTKADGSGISYIPGDRFYIKDNITLYAIWEKSEPEPTEAPTEEPTSTPEATKVPTEEPTATPKPTKEPTEEPTATPKATKAPTEEPAATPKATKAPTEEPAATPKATKAPTEEPTATPKPTKEPTQAPPVDNPDMGSIGNSGENNTVLPGSTHIIGKAKFKVTSAKTVTYIATTDKKAKKLTIPDKVMINGQSYNVTAVGANVCKNSKKLTAVVLGKNVVVIEAKAFYNYKKLKNIKFTSTKISKIGKNAFKGINKKAVFKVPKKAKKKYKSKLNKKVGFVKKTMVIK